MSDIVAKSWSLVAGQDGKRRSRYPDGSTDEPGVVALTTTAITVTEGNTATITAARSGGSDGAIAVDWAVSNALSTPASGTLTWDAAESGSKSATPTASLVESQTAGTVTLSNPRRTDAGSPAPTLGTSSGTITVNDYNPSLTPTTLESSVTRHGITWTFSEPRPVGYFITGDPFVIGPVSIIAIDPPSVLSGGRYMNGSMLNPPVTNTGGYDNNRGASTYDHSLNVAFGVSELSPLVISPSPVDSLVSMISANPAPKTEWPLERGAVLTVLSEVPADGAFRPPYVDVPNKSVAHFAGNVDLSKLPSLSRGAIGVPAPASVQANRYSWIEHGIQWTREHMVPLQNNHPYGREASHALDIVLGSLISDFAVEDKRELAYWLVQVGIDLYGVTQHSLLNGITPWSPDGAWSHGRKMPIVVAGHLLGDAAMTSVTLDAGGCFFQEDAMYKYVDQADIDATNSPAWSPSYAQNGSQPYSQAMLGMPEWSSPNCRVEQSAANGNAYWQAHPYRVAGNMNTHHMAALGILAMGIKEAWGNDAFFDFARRYVEIMDGRADPFGAGSYISVDGVYSSSGAVDWQRWWYSKWRYDLFRQYFSSVYY